MDFPVKSTPDIQPWSKRRGGYGQTYLPHPSTLRLPFANFPLCKGLRIYQGQPPAFYDLTLIKEVSVRKADRGLRYFPRAKYFPGI